jgi:transaldolase / glucose-6-phosphate isomerase
MTYEEILEDWKTNKKIEMLWKKQSALWTGKDENRWLGWLDIVKGQLHRVDEFTKIQEKFEKFKYVGLLGMGGSSLCPEVLAKTFGSTEGFPKLFVLDSTDPAQVKSFEEKLDLGETCFIVATKSGSTLEPNVFLEYFYERAGHKNFIAITDPGSAMEKKASALKFLDIFYGIPSIGGRYSAFSDFGIIPALAIGLDVSEYLAQTQMMVERCGPKVDLEKNPGFILGAQLASQALAGRDKMTLVSSPELSSLPGWIEQLVAESMGKNGKGIIPVIENEVLEPKYYGDDRHFIYLKLKDSSKNLDKEISKLKDAGFPVLTLETEDIYDLGQEFYRWEMGTAITGAILKVNPFDQPDVEASKVATRYLTDEYEKIGYLSHENPIFEEGDIKLFSDEHNFGELMESKPKSLKDYLKAHFSRAKAGDYFGLLAYIEMNSESEELLDKMKIKLQHSTKIATCVGFGPRFLHSTGQAYKGGPNTGVFLQITCEPVADLQIPNQKFTFGVVEAAQALGDFQVLATRERRLLRVHITGNTLKGLQALVKEINENT